MTKISIFDEPIEVYMSIASNSTNLRYFVNLLLFNICSQTSIKKKVMLKITKDPNLETSVSP